MFFLPGEPASHAATALKASRLLAAIITVDLYAEFLDAPAQTKAFDDDDDLAVILDLLSDGGVLELEAVQEVLGTLGESVTLDIAPGGLAIDAALDDAASEELRRLLGEAIGEGEPLGDFLARMDTLLEEEGVLPGTLDGYLENVFRTEAANEYARARDEYDQLPGMADHTWGYEFFNPDDSRTRDTHAQMSGKRVRRGSDADKATRPGPPWHYQCRCERIPLVVLDPANTDYVEDDDVPAIMARMAADGHRF